MEVPNIQKLTPFFLYLVVVATIGPLLFGYHLAELNAPQEVLTCVRHGIDSNPPLSWLPQCIPMTIVQFSVVSSSFTFGGLIGALVAGAAAEKYGRLRGMRYTTLAFIAGPIAEASATNVEVMALGRFISGIGAGAAIVIVPIYIFEITPVDKRGFFGSITQVMVNCGILLTQLIGYFLSKGQLWRIILGTGGVIGIIQLCSLLFAVESPKWHIDHGYDKEGKTNLQRIRGSTYNLRDDEDSWNIPIGVSADEEDEAEQLLSEETESFVDRNRGVGPASHIVRNETLGIIQVLSTRHYTRAITAVMMIMLAQQFTGINSIVMYGVGLLSDLLAQSSALLNVTVAAFNVIVTFVFAPLSDRLGRKPCLIISILGMGLSSFLLAIAIINDIKILAAVTVMTFVGSFGIGLGPLPFILSSELVGPEAVGATQSLALAANWTSTFIVAQFFPILNKAMGKGKVYYVFAALAAVFAAFVAWFVPESKGRSVDEIWNRAVRSQSDRPRSG